MVKNGSTDSLYYTYCDYQGNLLAVTDALGNVKEKLAYDPWGLRRSPSNWTQTDSRTSFLFSRGYTMHEHLDGFGLINMNGRVYDPIMAQFLSPDPFIQAPGNWYNYNRYGYCYNNPLIYNDPSGEIIGFLLAIWAGNYLINSVAYAINNNTSLKTAFKATPIVGGVGFSPTGFVTGQSNMGFSHPQLDAHLAVKNEMRVSRELDRGVSVSDWNWGYSADVTIATPYGGYSYESGDYGMRDGGALHNSFISKGNAYGAEVSAGINVFFVIPLGGFEKKDFSGYGHAFTVNFGSYSLSFSGNSTRRYPEDSMFDSYIVIKLGYGRGAGISMSRTQTEWGEPVNGYLKWKNGK